MDILQAIILSVIEGVTEFLPISSTGHMILAADLLRIEQVEFVKSFEVIIQLGAIAAVVMFYLKILLKKREIWLKLITAFIPTGIVGLVLYKFIKQFLLGNTSMVLWSLFFGGVVLIVWEKVFVRVSSEKKDDILKISYKQAMMIGLFQAISVVPGVSRAAATIVGGMSMGLSRRAAVEFSFLLALPTMIAATGLDLARGSFSFSSFEWMLLGIGFVVAFVTALVTVKLFLKFVEKSTFVGFGVYRILLAIMFWVFIMV